MHSSEPWARKYLSLSPPWGLWQRLHWKSGCVVKWFFSSEVLPFRWHPAQSSLGGSRKSESFSEPCGKWQAMQAAGLFIMCLKGRLLVSRISLWHLRQRSFMGNFNSMERTFFFWAWQSSHLPSLNGLCCLDISRPLVSEAWGLWQLRQLTFGEKLAAWTFRILPVGLWQVQQSSGTESLRILPLPEECGS